MRSSKSIFVSSSIDRRTFLYGLGAAGLAATCRCVGAGPTPAKKELIVHKEVPLNAEPAMSDLVKSWITPIEHFYVRSHAPVPKIDVDRFQLSIEGMVDRPLKISLKQLQNEFEKQSVVATMTCAGNRRGEHSLTKPVSGVPWQAGAIGNARWGGARLTALLKKAGVKEGAKHVWFEGVDEIKRTSGVIPFGASIPLQKAISDSETMGGPLVAYEMNDEPLSPDHGFPVRTVVPGFIGARSVKWVGKIIVSDRPSTNHYVTTAYKLVTEGTDQMWSAAPPIYEFVINSAICHPTPGTKLHFGEVTISGYALPPGMEGRTIRRVEVSADGGKTWNKAEFKSKSVPFCWLLWQARVKFTTNTKLLTVRAIDSAGNVQPRTVAWNLKGYLYNAWHRTPVKVSS